MVSLSAAKALSESMRFSEDRSFNLDGLDQLRARSSHKDSMLRNGLLISEAMTPRLEFSISDVCNRLRLPRENVTAFVYNSSDVQADCFVESSQTCVLRFTSGLVNLMSEKEFQFVAAHEIGHFLLGHGASGQNSAVDSIEHFMIRRAQELSADRIGYLGVGSLDESIQAIIKTASGLSREFLRFDVSSFMSQALMLGNPGVGESVNSSHPSLLIRCRALLWFSMSVSSAKDLSCLDDFTISNVDVKVAKDLKRFVDGRVRQRKFELAEDILLWKICVLVVNEGALKKELQSRILKHIGELNLNGLKTFIELYDGNNLAGEAMARLNESLKSTYTEFPQSAEKIESESFDRAYQIIYG